MKNNKAVIRDVIALSLPIAVQNIFSTAVSSADVLMVGMIVRSIPCRAGYICLKSHPAWAYNRNRSYSGTVFWKR